MKIAERKMRILIMKKPINNGKIKVADLNINPVGIIPPKVSLRGVRLTYQKDAEGKRISDDVVAIKYDVMDPVTLGTFTVKVDSNRPVITPEAFEAAETTLYLELPLNEIKINPYSISYGIAEVSVVAPSVKLANNGKQ